MRELITDIGIAGFFFFLIKGLLWVALFFLVYFGVIDKEKAKAFKGKLRFWKRSKNTTE